MKDCRIAEDLRRALGQVSGTFRKAAMVQPMPNSVSTTNTMRQPAKRRIWPPSSGASSGPTEVTIATIDSTLAASAGSCASRAIARDSTEAAPAPSACRKRSTIRLPIDGATKQPAPATVNSTIPPSSTGRRPSESDSGPYSSMPSEKPDRKLVSVHCTADALVPRLSATEGMLGRYMSVPIGPHAASAPSSMINRASGRRRIAFDMGILACGRDLARLGATRPDSV